MRSVLCWAIYGLIPQSGGLVTRPGEPVPISLIWTLITVAVFAGWGVMILYLSVLWRDKLDGLFVLLAHMIEEIFVGKKNFGGSYGDDLVERGRNLLSFRNQNGGDMKEWKEGHVAELGVAGGTSEKV